MIFMASCWVSYKPTYSQMLHGTGVSTYIDHQFKANIGAPRTINNCYFPLYWLFSRDPYENLS